MALIQTIWGYANITNFSGSVQRSQPWHVYARTTFLPYSTVMSEKAADAVDGANTMLEEPAGVRRPPLKRLQLGQQCLPLLDELGSALPCCNRLGDKHHIGLMLEDAWNGGGGGDPRATQHVSHLGEMGPPLQTRRFPPQNYIIVS